MKVLLAGYEGSKMILPVSSWLLKKYLPKGFDVYYLNFGSYEDKLYRGKFISLAEKQERSWSYYLHRYISRLKDKHVIFGLDDYLLGEPVDMKTYNKLLSLLGGDVKCARLCDATWYPQGQYNHDENGIMSLKRGADYTVTAQYTIWDREVLLEILAMDQDAWSFESGGSKRFEEKDYGTICSYVPPFKYNTLSSLSGKSGVVNWTGVNEEDLKYIHDNIRQK